MKLNRLVLLSVLTALFGCSGLKTRDEVKEQKKIEAMESGEYEAPAGPIEDDVLDDSLAEMGMDPNQAASDQDAGETPEPEVNSSEKTGEMEAAKTPEPTPAPPVAQKPVAKKAAAKKPTAKKPPVKKKVAKKTTAQKPTTKKPAAKPKPTTGG